MYMGSYCILVIEDIGECFLREIRQNELEASTQLLVRKHRNYDTGRED